MPHNPINYANTIIYKIVCNDINITDCYIGSTTDFTARKCCHKSICINQNDKNHNFNVYKFIRENGNWNNWSMILIENFPCKNKREAEARERYWYEKLNATLNSQRPFVTEEEEKIKNYIRNRTEIICECGIKSIKGHIARHRKSQRHNNAMNNISMGNNTTVDLL